MSEEWSNGNAGHLNALELRQFRFSNDVLKLQCLIHLKLIRLRISGAQMNEMERFAILINRSL